MAIHIHLKRKMKDYNLQPEGEVMMKQIMRCKNEGSAARRSGKTFSENPYKVGSERMAWQQGWREANRGAQ